MQKTKRNKKILVFLLIFLFALSPFRFSNFSLKKINADWPEPGSLVIGNDDSWNGNKEINYDVVIRNNATLTIEKGTHIEFHKKDNGMAPAIYVENGNIDARGSEKEKIVFTSAGAPEEGFSIYFGSASSKESFLRYVDIEHGGRKSNAVPIGFQNNLLNNAFAQGDEMPAIFYFLGPVHIENSRFTDNFFSDVQVQAYLEGAYEQTSHLEIVNSNFEGSNQDYAITSSISCQTLGTKCSSKILLKDDWYGNSAGPTYENFIVPFGKKVKGSFQLDGYRENDLIADPAIVIPGITGSYKAGGKWIIDPILFAYSDLLDSFQVNGYKKDKNLFDFPYDWKRKNEDTANDLEAKISEIKNITKISKVDLVGHSMGGLVARYVIENIDNNSVDQLITLGTPNDGSPEAYLKWEAGEGFFTWTQKVARHHFYQEATEAGYQDIFEYIRAEIPSVGELLPDYGYLSKNGAIMTYPDYYPRNTFLEKLNESTSVAKLSQIRTENIVGNLDNDRSTINEIKITNSTVSNRWEHGMPENFYNESTDQGIIRGRGDETVPVSSASAILANETATLDSSHGDLPTKAQKKIIGYLTGKDESSLHYVNDIDIPDIFLINVFSPVDIQIVSPSGKRVGKDFATGKTLNEIPNAFYTGYQEPCENNPKKMCEVKSEFVTIPNPEKGNYKILTQGTDNGDFNIELAKISKNPDDLQNAKEVMASIEGATESAEETETVVDVRDNQINAGETNIKEKSGIGGLIQKVESYFTQGLIKTKAERNFLRSNLKRIKFLFKQIDRLSGKKSQTAKKDAKIEKQIANLERRINARIDFLEKHIQNKTGTLINQQTSVALIKDLDLLRP